MKNKKIVIFVGPSGVGKGTIEEILFEDQSLNLEFSISATTRKKRDNEKNGVHYYFITKEEFESGIKEQKFMEYDNHFNNYYGTLWEEIHRIHDAGKIPFLEIDCEGVKFIDNKILTDPKWDYHYIKFFIEPPSMDELRKRIYERNTESENSIETRMQKAEIEMQERFNYKNRIVNLDAHKAALEVAKIIKEEIGK
ncbi:guanylate kinase [Mycoplasma testudineum]|nr:guanylate kinase [Mycoplasma testudineum]